MEQDACERLLEEYRALRRRLEEIDFSAPDYDVDSNAHISQGDIDRLEELQERLDTECDIEMPDELESDLDLPEYAGKSPSEPRDYSSE